MSTFQIVSGTIDKPKGFRATGIYSGIKKVEKLDLGIIVSDVPAVAAAVYTTNLFQAAPLQATREALSKEGKLQAVVVNSGNANACTGEKGLDDAYSMQLAVEDAFNIQAHLVGVASTGVIGQLMPMGPVKEGISRLPKALADATGDYFSQAIMTTDLVEKKVCVEIEMDGKTVTIAGTAKGSGMIHPNMATMLAFITTDANLDHDYLQHILKGTTNETFNMITVDGDTSTNDMVVVLANGYANNECITHTHSQAGEFYEAFHYVMQELAKKIARDGEGATKLLEVEVKGSPTLEAARQVAKTVIGSNLVKTAVYGADANWGRIICAVGYSGAMIKPDRIDVAIGSIAVVKKGFPVEFSEEEALAYLQGEHVLVSIDLNDGVEQAKAWGCDLTYDYIKINASYRT